MLASSLSAGQSTRQFFDDTFQQCIPFPNIFKALWFIYILNVVNNSWLICICSDLFMNFNWMLTSPSRSWMYMYCVSKSISFRLRGSSSCEALVRYITRKPMDVVVRIASSHGGGCEGYCILAYDALQSDRNLSSFGRTLIFSRLHGVIIILILYLVGWDSPVGLVCQLHMIDDGDCGAISGIRICRGNRSTRRKPAPASRFAPQISHDQTRAGTRAAAVGSQLLTAWAVARRYVAWSSIDRVICIKMSRDLKFRKHTRPIQWVKKMQNLFHIKLRSLISNGNGVKLCVVFCSPT
jgi:hypothetical protein